MKKAFFLLLALLFLLTTSCDTTSQPPEPPQNLTPEDRVQANRGNFVETEDGCYYLKQDLSNGFFIYFSPRGSAAFYPLCNKPNCTHRDENCNAWCIGAFGYHNGALYAVTQYLQKEGQIELVKMNLDGSNHETVAPLPVQSGTLQLNFHRGKLYIYSLGDYAPIDPELDRFFVMDLDTYESTELFTDFFHEGNRFSYLNFFEDKLYVCAANELSSQQNMRMMEFDISYDTWRELVPLSLGASYATETTFYYLEPDVGFREYDLATGEIKDCGLPIEDAWWAAYDEDYIYLMGHGRNDEKEHTLYFLNRNYEYLDQVELTDGIFYGYVSSDKLYFSKDFEPLSHYISKSDIGSHKLSLQPLD